MFRIVALVACWSHDYWLDIRHPNPTIRSDDHGPSSHEFMLLSTSNDHPCDERIEDAITRTRAALPLVMDGHGELHSFAVLDDAAWARVVDGAPASLRRIAEANRSHFPNDDHEQDPTWLNFYGLDLDEALSMWTAAEVFIQPAGRHGASRDAPAALI